MQELKVDLIHLPSQGTGQTVYSENLIKELNDLADLNEIAPNKIPLFNFFNHFSNSLAIKFLPFLLLKKIRKNSVVHITNQELFFLAPKITNPLVLTLHDFSHFVYYKNWKEKEISLLDKAGKIICISNSTRNELIKFFPQFNKKAVVIHDGTEKNLKKSNQNIRKKYAIKQNQRIILFVGSDDPKKNFFALLKAFAGLKNKNLFLVKIGSKYTFSGKNERIKFKKFIEENSLQEKVKFLDFVSRQDLIDFYFESEVFVMPTHYEGFGFPVLEAMSCSCPVICSDNTSLPEIAGSAAIFFDSKNSDELKEKLTEVLNNGNLRKKLIKAGFENIKRFNWEKTAEETFGVYKKISS